MFVYMQGSTQQHMYYERTLRVSFPRCRGGVCRFLSALLIKQLAEWQLGG
jgi:hypothetical protein